MTLVRALVAALYVITLPILAVAADEQRKLDFTQPIRLIDGSAMTECAKFSERKSPNDPVSCESYHDVTLGAVAYAALVKSEQGLAMTEQGNRWRLARKVFDASAVDLSKPDVTTIMTAISKLDVSLEIRGQAYCMLDQTFC
jgi:hypothetical protein